jgi:hypothetical protein
MNEGLESIRSLLDSIEKVGATSVQVAQVGQALADMATSLSAVAQAQERPPTWVTELVAAIRSLKEDEDEGEEDGEEKAAPMWAAELMAAIRNVQIINNVQPAEVTLPPMPSAAAQMPLMSSGVRMRVTKRDDLGRLSELVFIPEN